MNECVAQTMRWLAAARGKEKILSASVFHESFPRMIRKSGERNGKDGEMGAVRMTVTIIHVRAPKTFVVVIVKLNRITRYMFHNNSSLPLSV